MGSSKNARVKQEPSPCEEVSVGLKPNSHQNDVVSHIDLVFGFKSVGDQGTREHSQAVLSLTPHNLDLKDVFAIPDKVLKIFENREECRVYAHSTVVHISGTYNASNVWTVNLTGEGNFGPHEPLIQLLRSFAVHGGHFHILASHAETLPAYIDAYKESANEDLETDPYSAYWTGKARANYHRPVHIVDGARPKHNPARVALRDFDEFTAREVLSLRRDNDEKARTETI